MILSSEMTWLGIFVLVILLRMTLSYYFSRSVLSSVISSLQSALIILEAMGERSYCTANFIIVVSRYPNSLIRFSRLYASSLIRLSRYLISIFLRRDFLSL